MISVIKLFAQLLRHSRLGLRVTRRSSGTSQRWLARKPSACCVTPSQAHSWFATQRHLQVSVNREIRKILIYRPLQSSRFPIFRRLRLGRSSGSASTRHERSRRRRVGASLLGGTDRSRCPVEGLLERARVQLTVGSDLSALSDAFGLAVPLEFAGARYSAARLLLAGSTAARIARRCMQRLILVQRGHGIINRTASRTQGHQVVVRAPADAYANRGSH